MQRIFGALAVFGGWLCVPLSAVFGLIATEYMGLDHVEGKLPPSGLYGVPAMTILWIAVAAAILTAVPAVSAMFAPDPSRRLNIAAAAMFAIGVILLPEELGRAYSAALIPGAALLAAGGWSIRQAGPIGADTGAQVQSGDAAETAASLAPDPPGPMPEIAASSGGEPAAVATAPGKRSARRPARASAKARSVADPECPWCSARIAAGVERCPSCGAALISLPESTVAPIPGVTAVAPELRAYEEKVARQSKRPSLLSMILGDSDDRLVSSPGERVDPEILRPPSAEVRAEMERLDREIAAGGIVGEGTAATEPSDAAAPGPAPEAGGAPEPGAATDSRLPSDS